MAAASILYSYKPAAAVAGGAAAASKVNRLAISYWDGTP